MASKTYKINNVDQPLFNDATPEIRKVIVDIGCSVYKNLSSITKVQHQNDDIDQIRQDYELVISMKDQEIEYMQERLDEKKTELSNVSNNLREYYDKRSEQEIERLMKQQQDTIDYLKANIKTLEELKDKQENELKKYEKKENQKTVERGIEGETNVIDYLGKTFTEGHLENTTKKGAHGDIHFKYKGVDLLIEVKNKDNIILDDIAKFKRDVLEMKSQGGIFVSIKKGVNIPCHSIYDVEWLNDVPLIYITNFEVCESMLYTSIKTIHFYIQNSLKTTESKDNEQVREFNKLMDIVRCFSYSLNDLLVDTKKINDRILKLQNIIKEKVDLTIQQSYQDTIMELFRTYELAHDDLPTEDYMTTHGITKRMIRDMGGMKEIKRKYNSMTN